MVRTGIYSSDGLISLILWGLFSLVTVVSLWMLGDILLLGLDHLSLDFVVGEPADAGRNGGIAPLIVSTLLVLAVCMAVVIPVGLATALAITEFLTPEGRWQATLLRSLDLLSAVPSIVFGLFGYAFFAIQLGLGFSILSGGWRWHAWRCRCLSGSPPVLWQWCPTATARRRMRWRSAGFPGARAFCCPSPALALLRPLY